MKQLVVAIATLCSCTTAIAAEAVVDIEVAIMPGAPITAPQEWARRLGKLGLERVQIRSMRGEEKPATEMNDEGTRVDVLAVLTRQNELIFADRKFAASQLGALREYIDTLPEQIIEAGIVRGPFGFTEQEFQLVMTELSRPVTQATVGRRSRDLLTDLESSVRLPVVRIAGADALLRMGQPLAVELDELSIGTALAIALRRDGLTIRPEHGADALQLVVEPYQRGREVWPTGWRAEQSPRQIAPKLFESLSIEVEGYTLAGALTALEPRLGVPVIMDESILSRLNIDPEKISVKLPAKKTFLMGAVDKLLSQARLASELRIDEAGTAFLWITQFGPDSRPAP